MKQAMLVAVCLLCLTLWAPRAQAVLNAVDTVPAATLLLPYFEVDVVDDSITTIVTIHNVSIDSVIAHATVFTDFAVGSVAFDIELGGAESVTLDLAEIFQDNSLGLGIDTPNPAGNHDLPPALFAAGFEGGDLGEWDVVNARVSYETLKAWHTGHSSPRTHNCGGESFFNSRYRGYMLVDVVSSLGAGFQSEPGYFISGGFGKATNDNVLTGEFELRDSANNFSQSNALIHIEAGMGSGLNIAGNYTFYSRYVSATAADNRETIGSAFGARYLLGGAFDQTELIYWRDPKVSQNPVTCGLAPAWYPLGTADLVVYDEASNPASPAGVAPFALACGRVAVGSSDLPTPYNFGWIFADFNAVNSAPIGLESQGALFYVHEAFGRFSTGQHAIVLDHASSANP